MKIFLRTLSAVLLIGLVSCKSDKKTMDTDTYSDVTVVGAMKNVMWKGELGATVNLDTIANKKGLYALGPVRYLTGEILVNDGKSYVSRVTSDSTMVVQNTFDVAAPFLVYTNVTEWKEIAIPANIKSVNDIEQLVTEKTKEYKKPFAFKLIGKVATADIHIQNLPKGTKVSSPKEAHQGQTSYSIQNASVTLIGFFSTKHKGIFTHHDTNIHLHLITDDNAKMGQLDAVEIENMTLFLPKK